MADAGLSDVEARLAGETARRAMVIGPVVVMAAWVLRDVAGALAALFGVALVVGNFLLSGMMLSLAARISLALYQFMALFGFLLRLGLVTIAFLLVARLAKIDRPAFGVALVVSYLVLLSWEAVTVARRPSGEAV